LLRRLKTYFGALGKLALGKTIAGRGVTVFPNDIFLVSYLRSGSTWARFLVGNFRHEDKAVTFINVNRLVPAINGLPDHALRSLPRILKSHECFDPRYPRVVYFVRDPRDVAVSFYYYNLKVREIPPGYAMDEFVDRFVAAKTVSYADRLGSWEDHVLSWIRLRQGRSTFLLVRYEDLLRDPGRELTRMASLLGIEPTPERIQRAINLSSAEHMRTLEGREWKHWGTTKGTRPDIPFVREAKSGGWQKHLSKGAIRKIEASWGRTMRELGYELVTGAEHVEAAAVPVEK
jgi:hypothetical protein